MPKVTASDGKEFEISQYCVELSEELKGPEDASKESDEPLSVSCSGEIFQHILDYMTATEAYYKEKNKDVPEGELHPPQSSEFHHFGKAVQTCLVGIRDYERKYLDRFGALEGLNVELIIDVLIAADALQVMGLSELLSRRIAEFMRARRPEFIREKFHIPPQSAELTKAAKEMFDFYDKISA